MSLSSDFIDKYAKILHPYLPPIGQGDTMATQLSTAINRIIYRWFNDGDTIWTDECQSCADWLYQNIDGADAIIDSLNEYDFAGSPHIKDRDIKALYEDGLESLLKYSVPDEEGMKELDEEPLAGSIFDCEGPVLTTMEGHQEDDDWDDDDWDDDEYEEF